MISIILPTRKRSAILKRMIDSAISTAARRPEIVVYIDDDDWESRNFLDQEHRIKGVIGPRITLTNCWNKCLPLATGDILMQANDDIIFRTLGWDDIVEHEFEKFSDRIVLVHGSDEGQHFENFGAHPFIHRRWVETLGYFIPPYFTSDYGDTWLNTLANTINRRRYVPIIVEHMHFMYNKAPMDTTYEERLARHDPDGNDHLFAKKHEERWRDAAKLGSLMEPPLFLQRPLPIEPPFQIPLHLNLKRPEAK